MSRLPESTEDQVRKGYEDTDISLLTFIHDTFLPYCSRRYVAEVTVQRLIGVYIRLMPVGESRTRLSLKALSLLVSTCSSGSGGTSFNDLGLNVGTRGYERP